MAPATKPRSESLSAASTALPHTVPRWLRSATAFSTPSASRAQIATEAPSSSSVSAMARPMPFVEPVTMAFLPVSPRSMTQLLLTSVALVLLVLHSRKPLSKLGRHGTVVAGSTRPR